MLVITASEGERGESVVSEKSEKRVERGESGEVGGCELLDRHRNSTPIKSPSLRKLDPSTQKLEASTKNPTKI